MIVVESELDDIQILDISLSHSPQVKPTPPSTANQDLNSDDIFVTIASYQTTLSESWQEIYQVQTEISHSFAVACLCGSHNSEGNGGNLATAFDYSSTAFSTPLTDVSEHALHEHCSCGGHYKDGKCENCGRLEHDA